MALSHKGLWIERANHVWRRRHLHPGAAWLPLPGGDHGLGEPQRPPWPLSNTLDAEFRTEALEDTLVPYRTPENFYTDPKTASSPASLHRAPAECRHPLLDGGTWSEHGKRSAAHSDRWRSQPQSSKGCGARSTTKRSTSSRSLTASPPGASSVSETASTTPRGLTRCRASRRRSRPTERIRLWI